MNPLRSLFLLLSRTPPALMVATIVGLSVVITMAITTSSDASKRELEEAIKKAQEKSSAKLKVVYAEKDIPAGANIEADWLSEKDIEAGRAPLDALPSASSAIGRTTKYGVSAGQLLSSHDLAPLGIAIDFNSRLKEGMRAVTFAVDSNSGVAGFIEPQSHVDVLSMVGNGAETRVAPILSDVEIIAVGQTYERAPKGGANPASSVTVAVTPEDTQKLVKAVAASKLYLSLRNDRDHSPVTTVDVTALFAQPKKTVANEPVLTALEPPPLPGLPDITPGPSPMPMNGSAPFAVNVPPPLHEIEIWSGNKKDVLQVAKQ
jgi:pilus assembly protein CpaB